MVHRILLVLMMVVAVGCDAQPITCKPSEHDTAEIESLRSALLGSNFGTIQPLVDFPILAQMDGSIMEFDDALLESMLPYVLTNDVRLKLKSATACELIEYLGVESTESKYTINHLIFYRDEEDLKYSKSGIKSSAELKKFILEVNGFLKSGDYERIGATLDYPFSIHLKGGAVTIHNVEEFMQHKKTIINPQFKSLVQKSINEKNLHQRVTGVMLNERGDIWIQSIKGELKVVIINTGLPKG